ncbi:MAG: potassium/proton antiporter [Anaerolineae bacterium]|nr:potassium/proton antiporter [Anaerolineae bacterium]
MSLRTFSIEWVLLAAAILLLLSILASKASSRLGVPALLLFLLLGMLAGSEGPGGIYFDDPWLAQFLGSIALAYILYAGGLQTRWHGVRPIVAPAIVLATVGVVLTALLSAVLARVVFQLGWLESFLLGSIISSTDAAAVFSILRSKSTHLQGHLEPLLEMESGSNDPMAIFLTVAMTHLISRPDTSLIRILPLFVFQFGLGGLLGYGLGKLSVWFINRLNLHDDGLYPVLTTAIALFIFAVTATLQGSGFLAVYVAGIVMGNSSFLHKKSLLRFHDGLAWLMQITMFLALGLFVFPSRLLPVAGSGLLVAIFLMLVARPVSVLVCMLPFRYQPREIGMVAWVGLRGAAPIVLATFPLLTGIVEASWLFNIVFFVVLVSVALQGSFIPGLARWLKVEETEPVIRQNLLFDQFIDHYEGELSEIELPPDACAVGRRIVDLDLPQAALVVVIERANRFVIPRGDIVLEAGDRILIAAETEAMGQTRAILTRCS